MTDSIRPLPPPEAQFELGAIGRFLARPANIAFSVVFVSVLLLQIPQTWYGRVWSVGVLSFGFAEAALLCLVYLVFFAAWSTASRAAHNGAWKDAQPLEYGPTTQLWLTVVTLAGAVGVGATLMLLVSRLGLSGIVSAFKGSQANQLKEALYGDYSIGLTSLRYCPILAAPAAAIVFWRLRVRNKLTLLLLLISVASLLVNSAISHRLSIVAATLVFLVMHFRSGGRISFRSILLTGAAIVAVLAALNSSRNANFYSGIGITNPLAAAMSEAISYVATPAQGALAAMAILWTGDFNHGTGISAELTTNSSLLEVLRQFGYSGLFIELIGTTAAAYAYTRLYYSRRIEMVAGAGAIGYAFAEFWRVFFFQYGIFIVLLVFSIGAGWGLSVLRSSFARRASEQPPPPVYRDGQRP